MFCFHHVTESSIANSVHLDGEDVVLVQAILSIKAIVKLDAACHEKVLHILVI
jgi:AP-3 complex subunit beta